MSNSLNNNIAANIALRGADEASKAYTESLQKLTSGRRISKAADDPSGLAISIGIESDIRSNQQAQRNIMDGLSLTSFTDSALNELSNVGQRIRELTVQAANDEISDEVRENIQTEVDQLRGHAEAVIETTYYFGIPILNGQGKEIIFQTGIQPGMGGQLAYNAGDIDARDSFAKLYDVFLDDGETSADGVQSIDEFMSGVHQMRAKIGGIAFQLNTRLNQMKDREEIDTERLSRYRDADIAAEATQASMAMLRQNISMALLAQANSQQSYVLKLLEMPSYMK